MSQPVCWNCCRSNMSQNENNMITYTSLSIHCGLFGMCWKGIQLGNQAGHQILNSFGDIVGGSEIRRSPVDCFIGSHWTRWLEHMFWCFLPLWLCCWCSFLHFIHVTEVIMSKLSCEKLTKKGKPIALQQSTCFSPPHVVRCCAPDWRCSWSCGH